MSIHKFNSFVDASVRSNSQHYIVLQNDSVFIRHLPQKKWFKDSFTPASREENKKTWQVFNQVVLDLLGKKRFDRLSERYKVNFTSLENQGAPLLARHIQMVGVVAADTFTSDLKDPSKKEKLKVLSHSEIEGRIFNSNPIRYVGSPLNVHKIYGGPTEFWAHFFYDPLLMDRERLALFNQGISPSHEHAFLERFSKATVTRELSEGMLVPAIGDNGTCEYYKIYKKIAPGNGLVAFALKPLLSTSTLKPLLVFRPSQFAPSGEDFLETWINDGQLRLGKWGYNTAKKELRALMQDVKFCPPGRKIDLAGFSLAGAYIQRFLNDHALKVSQAVFFNDPSLDPGPAEDFANRMNALPRLSEKIRLKIYRTEGDKAHYMGEKHIGWGITHPDIVVEVDEIQPFSLDKIEGSYLHSHRFFDAPQQRYNTKKYRGAEVNEQLDNRKRGEDIWWYERMRQCTPVRFVYGYVCFVYTVGSFILKRLRVQIFRSSGDVKKPERRIGLFHH